MLASTAAFCRWRAGVSCRARCTFNFCSPLSPKFIERNIDIVCFIIIIVIFVFENTSNQRNKQTMSFAIVRVKRNLSKTAAKSNSEKESESQCELALVHLSASERKCVRRGRDQGREQLGSWERSPTVFAHTPRSGERLAVWPSVTQVRPALALASGALLLAWPRLPKRKECTAARCRARKAAESDTDSAGSSTSTAKSKHKQRSEEREESHYHCRDHENLQWTRTPGGDWRSGLQHFLVYRGCVEQSESATKANHQNHSHSRHKHRQKHKHNKEKHENKNKGENHWFLCLLIN